LKDAPEEPEPIPADRLADPAGGRVPDGGPGPGSGAL